MLDTSRFGVRAGTVEIELPAELHTGSPAGGGLPTRDRGVAASGMTTALSDFR